MVPVMAGYLGALFNNAEGLKLQRAQLIGAQCPAPLGFPSKRK